MSDDVDAIDLALTNLSARRRRPLYAVRRFYSQEKRDVIEYRGQRLILDCSIITTNDGVKTIVRWFRSIDKLNESVGPKAETGGEKEGE